jgi:ArsR family transcriptional regulator, zinc-responsive transcriptional repressor
MLGVMKAKIQPCPQNLTVEDLARMAQVLKLLAHPHRLKIIDILESEKEAPVHALVGRLALPQAATSGHLNLMRRAGLVESERRGKEVWYSLGDRRSLTILNCMRAKKGA